ncbi:MAG: hypothetical protein EBU84_01805 [Actinobacteria bacterium]|nr:hypothetical protein [Actinomycetota bacterium]
MAYDPSAYEARRRSYMQNYASTGAMEAYKNFLSQQRGQRDLAELNKQYEQGAPRVVAGYGRRNLVAPNVKSGVFAQAMRDYAKQRIQQTAQAQQALDQQQQGYELLQRQLQDQFGQNMVDLEAEKARQIEEDARQLLALRGGM